MRIFRSREEPIRGGLSTGDAWIARDNGVIACWERGRVMGQERSELAADALAGVLMILPWKGGVDRKLKAKAPKVGTYRYLAMWQGLRGDDLDIDTSEEVLLTCTKYEQTVLYTDDPDKYAVDPE